jgi:hypothetical protein
VLDFEVTSASGTNYRDRIVPVPEAGTALPVLAGLAVLARGRCGTAPVARARALRQ